ncbi:MAG TPA: DUF3343 domain-containing protein [Nitrospirota bacterium]|jgi:hypothetical protein
MMEKVAQTEGLRVFVFKSTYLTFKAERAFKKAGIDCKVVTKPRDISSDCGLAVSVAGNHEAKADLLLAETGIEKLGVW